MKLNELNKSTYSFGVVLKGPYTLAQSATPVGLNTEKNYDTPTQSASMKHFLIGF